MTKQKYSKLPPITNKSGEFFSPAWYKEQCAELKLRPEKSRGQNFLIDLSVAHTMTDAAELTSGDTVLEIGPGFGVLTQKLAQHAHNVIAVETEKKFLAYLCVIQSDFFCHPERAKRVEGSLHSLRSIEFQSHVIPAKAGIQCSLSIINSDILNFNETTLPKNYKLVANLPYAITTAVLQKFLLSKNPPASLTLLLQKEVVDRMCAKPPAMNRLAILTQLFGTPKKIRVVAAGAFWPRPKVDSAIITIPRHEFPFQNKEKIAQCAEAAFASPRKKISNTLVSLYPCITENLMAHTISKDVRPECLSLEDWSHIVR